MIACCTPASRSRTAFSPSSVDREFDRMVQTFFGATPFAVAPAQPRNIVRTGFPPINVWEDPQSFVVEAELPGFKLADLDINLVGNELTLSGARELAEHTDARAHRRERVGGGGRFSRMLRLGTDVDATRVAATLDSGVLTITLPKAEGVKPRKIEIKPA